MEASIAINAILAITAGCCDRIRGGFPEGARPKWVKYLAMTAVGPCLVAQATHEPLPLGLSVLIGHLIWRQDNGYKGQWVLGNYISGIYGAVQWAAVASIPFLLLGLLNNQIWFYFPAFIVGNVAAHFIALVMPKTEVMQLRNAWPWSELLALGFVVAFFHILRVNYG